MIRETEGVVSRRSGHDASRPLRGGETQQRVSRATLLERARALQVVALQPDLRTRHSRDLSQRRRNQTRRQAKPVREAHAGSFYIGKAQGRSGFGFHTRFRMRTDWCEFRKTKSPER